MIHPVCRVAHLVSEVHDIQKMTRRIRKLPENRWKHMLSKNTAENSAPLQGREVHSSAGRILSCSLKAKAPGSPGSVSDLQHAQNRRASASIHQEERHTGHEREAVVISNLAQRTSSMHRGAELQGSMTSTSMGPQKGKMQETEGHRRELAALLPYHNVLPKGHSSQITRQIRDASFQQRHSGRTGSTRRTQGGISRPSSPRRWSFRDVRATNPHADRTSSLQAASSPGISHFWHKALSSGKNFHADPPPAPPR